MFNADQRGASMTHTILRLPAVKSTTGLSRSTIYLRIAQGVFTHPVSLGARAVGWPAHEVVALNAARIAGKPDSELRELVAKLEAARTAKE
jgi:prophage regulatory protein